MVKGLETVCISHGCRHDGAVWQVAWAHPKFGNILASCSYDRKVSQGMAGRSWSSRVREMRVMSRVPNQNFSSSNFN